MDRREYNREATKRHIENTLLKMLSEGKFLHQISTVQLCCACNIAKSTFYLYYPDKFAVMEGIAERAIADLEMINSDFGRHSISDIVSGKPTPIAKNLVSYLSENKQLLKVLLGPTGFPGTLQQGKSKIEEKFKELYRALHLNPKYEQLAASQFFAGVIGLFQFYLFENTEHTDEQMVIVFGNMLKNVLRIADNL